MTCHGLSYTFTDMLYITAFSCILNIRTANSPNRSPLVLLKPVQIGIEKRSHMCTSTKHKLVFFHDVTWLFSDLHNILIYFKFLYFQVNCLLVNIDSFTTSSIATVSRKRKNSLNIITSSIREYRQQSLKFRKFLAMKKVWIFW